MTDVLTVTLVRGTTSEGHELAIRDLSPAGARLVGTADVFEGERVYLTLALEAQPVQIAADVTGVDRQRQVVEVVFKDITPEALVQIERSIAALLLTASRASTVLVVHPVVDVSSALERDLARVAVAARVCPRIENVLPQLDPSVIGVVIAGSYGEAAGTLLEQLEYQHPKLRRVLLFGDHLEKVEHAAARRVHAVLRTPWRFKGLARALDLPSEDVVTTYDQLVALQVPKKD